MSTVRVWPASSNAKRSCTKLERWELTPYSLLIQIERGAQSYLAAVRPLR